MAVLPSSSPVEITIIPGATSAFTVRFLSRSTASADAATIDLTGYTVIDVALKSVDNDKEYPSVSQVDALSYTGTISNQTTNTGEIEFEAAASATDDLQVASYTRLKGDILLTDAGGVTEKWADVVAVVQQPISTTTLPAGSVTVSPLVQEMILLEGPDGTTPPSNEITVVMTTTSTTDLYTSATSGVIVIDAVIRLAAVADLVSVPTVYFKRSTDNQRFNADQTLNGLTTTTESRRFSFIGTIPVLDSGEKIQLVVDTAASATTYTGAVSVKIR